MTSLGGAAASVDLIAVDQRLIYNDGALLSLVASYAI